MRIGELAEGTGVSTRLQCARGEEARLDLCPEPAGLLNREPAATDEEIGAPEGYLSAEP